MNKEEKEIEDIIIFPPDKKQRDINYYINNILLDKDIDYVDTKPHKKRDDYV